MRIPLRFAAIGTLFLVMGLGPGPAWATLKFMSTTPTTNSDGTFVIEVVVRNNDTAQRCARIKVIGSTNSTAGVSGPDARRADGGGDEVGFRIAGRLTDPTMGGTVTIGLVQKGGIATLADPECAIDGPTDNIHVNLIAAPTYNAMFKLSGSQEVPSVPSSATGQASMSIYVKHSTGGGDPESTVIVYSITHDVVGPTVAHIHGPAQRDKSAGVLVAFPSAASPMVGTLTVTGGTAVSLNAAMLDDRTYVNVHSGAFPSGEIRGQIPGYAPDAVPGLGEWGMALLAISMALAGVVFVQTRRATA